MVQWDGATMQQKSSQLTGPDIHLYDHTPKEKKRKEKKWDGVDFILQHMQMYTYTNKHAHTLTQANTHTLAQKQIQNELTIAYITLAICNLSCSPRKIIEATSQYANRMIISLRHSAKHICTEKNSYIVSNF